jgi:glycerol uptake facilitator-like aquaporin
MIGKMRLVQRVVAETVGTAMLLAAVVGSGIMGERLAAGNNAIVLLANSIATGAALFALIITFSRVSGAHFNPVVSVASAFQQNLPWHEVPIYIASQIAGAFVGVGVANAMFGLPVFFASHHVRNEAPLLLGEAVATFGLLLVIWGSSRFQESAISFAVSAYITGAYWFTSSTSFANPAVTIARSASDTFAGIRLLDVPAFIGSQFVGALAAMALVRWMTPKEELEK